MKILSLVDGIGWCGTKEQAYLMSRGLKEKGFKIDMAIAFDFQEMIKKVNGKIPVKFFQDTKTPKYSIKNLRNLRKLLKEGQYDIIITHSSNSLNIYLLSSLFLNPKPKSIALKRSSFIPSFLSRTFKYSQADRIVVTSKFVKEQLVKHNFHIDKLRAIESGIDLSRFKPVNEYRKIIRNKLGIKEEEVVFINVANWQPWRKGQDILLKAFKNLSCVTCKLILVGNGTASKEAKGFIEKLGLKDKVLLLGFRRDIEKLLQGADYFVLSSNSEGIAGALLQAMASGKVVLSTLAGGIGEYLKDMENGFAVPVRDGNGLAEKMKKMLSLSESEYRDISKKAVRTAQNYSMENNIKKWIELIEEVAF